MKAAQPPKSTMLASSRPGDRLLDFFAGSGSFGEAGASAGRELVLVDESDEAIEVMKRRFRDFDLVLAGGLGATQPESRPKRKAASAPREGTASKRRSSFGFRAASSPLASH
jgi:molybdopterin-biosynthesis enzyme MoeA-like protein